MVSRVVVGVVVAGALVLGVALAQSPAVWTVDSVGFFTSNGQRTHRRIVLRGPLDAPVPARGSRWTLAAPPAPPQPPPAAPVFGTVDPTILGTCSAAAHDAHMVDGGDGWRYRTWHPQRDPSGCIYAHEHGDDPASVQHPEILGARPVAFGLINHAMQRGGMAHPEEPHQGFKVFVARPGQVNDEDRVNRVFSLSVFHMGTGGPARFAQRFHSADIRVMHPEFGLRAFTQLMMDTGGTGAVCDPRIPGATKDVMRLDFPSLCGGQRLGSAYEIWRTEGSVLAPDGREVYHAFANPAVFDPITVLNPAHPSEVVYAWDPRMAQVREFRDDWSMFRGCERESYAQPGYWYNASGPTVYWTDAMGRAVLPTAPGALRQDISASDSIGAPATHDGLGAFKLVVSYCGLRASLGLRN